MLYTHNSAIGQNIDRISFTAAHEPVMAEQVLEWLRVEEQGVYVDCTAGPGGHHISIAKRAKHGRALGIDWDKQSLDALKSLREVPGNVTLVHGNYRFLADIIRRNLSVPVINGLLLDLGISSFQLADAERGFSFTGKGPLDMRFSCDETRSLKTLLQRANSEDIARILKSYGAARNADAVSRAIKDEFIRGRLNTTEDLVNVVKRSIPRRFWPSGRHVATTVFQALRMWVNNEQDNISAVLSQLAPVMAARARVCVITYHSGEDALVKSIFARLSAGTEPLFVRVTKKPVVPSRREIIRNPRARSAKMRIAEKTHWLTEIANHI